MRYLTVAEVIWLHQAILAASGGAAGIRDVGGLESALAQPRAAFGGAELYPTLADKAAALLYSLVLNHPFFDGNKRVGHAATEIFLLLNGSELIAPISDQEHIVLSLAAGELSREDLRAWLADHLRPSKAE
jgi:death on curing protein